MEFANDVLKRMHFMRNFNKQYSKWYFAMFKEFEIEMLSSNRFKKRSDRILDCLNLWLWDEYRENLVLDLQKVNRCMNNRFCPNCRKLDLVRAMYNLVPVLSTLISRGYYPFLLTLTVPNVDGDNLRSTLDKLNKSFSKFYRYYSVSLDSSNSFKNRYLSFDAALKALEITFNSVTRKFHAHTHSLVFSFNYDKSLFSKCIPGPFSKKSNRQIFYSDMDLQIMKLWKFSYDNIRISNFDSYSSNWWDLYQCDIREADDCSLFEVLKYSFKDSDISDYYVFKNLVFALENKRIRQGYGLLYNVKVENVDSGSKQDLFEFLNVNKEELPHELLTQSMEALYTRYSNYTKISRFNKDNFFNKID